MKGIYCKNVEDVDRVRNWCEKPHAILLKVTHLLRNQEDNSYFKTNEMLRENFFDPLWPLYDKK